MDALYFRVSSERQTTENQFEDVLKESKLSIPLRPVIREWLELAIQKNCKGLFVVDPAKASILAEQRVYLEHSSARGYRPAFERMMRDARAKEFDRLLCWKVSRLGRNMMEVLQSVHELSELGVTVVPVKSATGPINTSMGKLLWAIQSWAAEFENDERTEAIKAGLVRARAEGKQIGRPKRIFDREEVVKLRDAGKSWQAIADKLRIGKATAKREYLTAQNPPSKSTAPSSNSEELVVP